MLWILYRRCLPRRPISRQETTKQSACGVRWMANPCFSADLDVWAAAQYVGRCSPLVNRQDSVPRHARFFWKNAQIASLGVLFMHFFICLWLFIRSFIISSSSPETWFLCVILHLVSLTKTRKPSWRKGKRATAVRHCGTLAEERSAIST